MTRLSCCCDWGFDVVLGTKSVVDDIFSYGGGSPGQTVENFGYSISSDSWTQHTSKTVAFSGGASYPLNGKAYSAGADFASGEDHNEEYTPASDSWAAKTDLPAPGRGNMVSTAINDFGIIAGGDEAVTETFLQDVDEYDPSGDSWTAKTDIPTPARRTGMMSSVNTTDAYFVGGDDNGTLIADNDEYNRSGDSWTAKTDIISPARASGTSASIDGKVYVATGISSFSPTALQDVDEYDPSGDSWTAKTDCPTPARYFSSFDAVGGNGYLHHGQTSSSTRLGDLDMYDQSADTWSSLSTNTGTNAERIAAGHAAT